MRAPPDTRITFHVEPADRGVGIMSEGFSAWVTHGETLTDVWVNLEEYANECSDALFKWFSNETGDEVPRPKPDADVDFVERSLHAFVLAFYSRQADSEGPTEMLIEPLDAGGCENCGFILPEGASLKDGHCAGCTCAVCGSHGSMNEVGWCSACERTFQASHGNPQ